MNIVLNWLTSPTGQHLLEALGHSLWLGALLVLGLSGLLRMLPTERASLRYGILLASQISLIFLVIFTWTLLGTGRPSPVRTNPESAGSSERAALTATHVDAGIVSKAPVRSSTHAGEIRKSTPLSNLIRRGIGLAWVIGAALILSWRPVQLLRTRRIGLLLEPGRTLGYRIPLGSTLNSLGLAALFIISTHQVALFAAETINQAERINHIEAASLYRLPADSPIPRDAKMKLSGNIYSPDGKPVKALVYKTEMRPSADGIGNSSSYNSKLTNQYIEDFSFWRKWGQQPATFLESVNLLALAPGFTPSQEINIPAEPGERKINLYLKPAIASSIQVVDTDGNPVPGARLRYDYLIRNTDSLHFSPTPIQSPEKLTTDENGLVHWAAPEDFPIRFEVTADGYLDLFHKQIRFTKAEASPVFTLFPGHPLRGRIIDAETGKGIAGAEIQYLASFPRGHRPYASWHSDDRLSKSDTEGRFITYRLEADGRHWLVARAPGYLAAFPGQIDGRNAETFDERFSVRVKDSESPVFRMIPQRPIRIEITPPEGMQPDAMELYIKSKLFVGSKNTVSNPWSSSLKIQTREISADGKKLIVETTPVAVSPIEVKLRVPGRPSRIIQDWRYGTDLEADFRAAPATRRDKTLVYVTFDLPPEAPPPKGNIVIYWQMGEHHYNAKSFEIEEGGVQAYVDCLPDTPVTIFARGMMGYYFPPHTIRPLNENSPVRIRVRKLLPAGAVRLKIDGRKKGSGTSVKVEFANPDAWRALLANYPADPGIEISPEYVTARIGKIGRRFKEARPLDYPFRLSDDDENIFITPVPLEEPVKFWINQGPTHLISNQILTANDALLDLELKLPEGIRFTGTLLNQDGAPLVNREIMLHQNFQHVGVGHMLSTVSTNQTDQNGDFAFEGINPNAATSYSLELKIERGSRVLATELDITESFKIYRIKDTP